MCLSGGWDQCCGLNLVLLLLPVWWSKAVCSRGRMCGGSKLHIREVVRTCLLVWWFESVCMYGCLKLRV